MLDENKHINWEDFHFLRAEYLWICIPVLAICLIGVIVYKQSNSWKKNIAKHLQPYVIQKGTEWKSRLMHVSVLIMFGLGLLALFGPTWSREKSPAKEIKSQLVIALDLSHSMLAEDVSPNRLERAKFKLHDLLTANPRAETALLVYAGSTHMAVPFTTDYKIIENQIDGLKPSMMPIRGTEFNLLFNRLDTIFSQNKAEGKVLLMTDDLDDLSIEKVSQFMQQNNVQLFIYPLATQSGARIPKTSETSSLNLQQLSSLESLDRVSVLDMTLDNSDVEAFATDISDTLVVEDKKDETDEKWLDQGYWLLLPIAFFFMFSFRKGWSLNIIIIGLFLSSCSSKPEAERDFEFIDLWYTQDYQAQLAFENEDYATAASQFTDPLRQGISYYKNGDYISAITAFQKDTTTAGLYNLGLTYAELGDFEKAQSIFEEVLLKDPNNDSATKNLEQVTYVISQIVPEEITEEFEIAPAENSQNDSPEDLSGGGQEATKEDMEVERKEEEVDTETRIVEELDELPEDFQPSQGQVSKDILMRKVKDDPAIFLTKKFRYQVKKKKVEVVTVKKKW